VHNLESAQRCIPRDPTAISDRTSSSSGGGGGSKICSHSGNGGGGSNGGSGAAAAGTSSAGNPEDTAKQQQQQQPTPSTPQQQQQQWEPWQVQPVPAYHETLLWQLSNPQMVHSSEYYAQQHTGGLGVWYMYEAAAGVLNSMGALSEIQRLSLIQLLIEGAGLMRWWNPFEFKYLQLLVHEMHMACMHGGRWQRYSSLLARGRVPQPPRPQWVHTYMGLFEREAEQLLLPVLQQLSPLVLYALQRAPAVREQYAQEQRVMQAEKLEKQVQRSVQLEEMRRQLQQQEQQQQQLEMLPPDKLQALKQEHRKLEIEHQLEFPMEDWDKCVDHVLDNHKYEQRLLSETWARLVTWVVSRGALADREAGGRVSGRATIGTLPCPCMPLVCRLLCLKCQ
jgi:hypothetical protein